jgi:hypothetical protein
VCLDLYVHVRLDAGDAYGKDVGRLAGDHDGLFPGFLCLFILVLRVLAALQLGLYPGIAECDLNSGDCRVSRQREAVAGFEDLIALLFRKAVNLCKAERGQRTRNLSGKLRPAERSKNDLIIFRLLFVDDLEDADAPGTAVLISALVEYTDSSLCVLNLPLLLRE